MRKRDLVIIHLLFLLCLVMPISCASLLFYLVKPTILYSFFPEATFAYVVKDAIFNTLSFSIAFYVFYFLVFEWLFRTENWRLGALKAFTLFIIIGAIEQFFVLIFYPEDLLGEEGVFESILLYVWLLFRMGLAIGGRAMVAFLNEQRKRKALEKFNLQSELSLFRAQVNPHFLFNTLNNIDALIYVDQDKASETLIKLSKQMRYMLHESNTEAVLLDLELEFLRNYIDLESIRLTNKNFVSFEVKGKTQGIYIAPMLFIAFVENAFKHGTDTHMDKGLQLTVEVDGKQLHLVCKNRYNPSQPKKKVQYSGVGLELVKKRLGLIYPDQHNLEIKTQEEQFCVYLTINL